MGLHRLGACAAVAAVMALVACGSSSDSTANAGGTSGSGGSGAGGGTGGKADGATDGGEICTATFTWLQKDAYKDTAGRSSQLWPPHTTTTLDIECNGSVVRSTYRENHGTKPGEVDKNGDVFLVPVNSMQTDGPLAELESLADAYEGCECETKFLSMDALGDAAVQDLVKTISDYITQNLTCTGAVDAAGLATLLQQGDIQGVLDVLPNCTWSSGSDWSSGFDQALSTIIAASNETLADYHVCNNDAEIEAALFDAYRSGNGVGACDNQSSMCHGPKWFYTP